MAQTKPELAAECKRLKKRVQELENLKDISELECYVYTGGYLPVMAAAGINQVEFEQFMLKHARFIRHAMTAKLMQAIGTEQFANVSNVRAAQIGLNCFQSVLTDFNTEFTASKLD